MNLLDFFVLQHVQVSLLTAELVHISKDVGAQEAKVELNLTPRLMKADGGDRLPTYQVGAMLTCHGGSKEGTGPMFNAKVGFEAIYQQVEGNPVDVAEFTSSHASLTRQLYPLLQQELRTLLVRLGLEQIHLPFDLAARIGQAENQTVQISGSVH
jgi:hypothetical protein